MLLHSTCQRHAIHVLPGQVLYVSTGRDLPDFSEDNEDTALDLKADLEDLDATQTPVPSTSHHAYTKGKGLNKSQASETRAKMDKSAPVDLSSFEPVDHGEPPPFKIELFLFCTCGTVSMDGCLES